MKILITGGAGFIGCHLAKMLIGEGHSVDIVDNLHRGVIDKELESLISLENVNFFEKNLLHSDGYDILKKDYELIYHLAAIIGVKHVLNKPYQVLNDNQVLLHNAIEFAKKQQNLHRFIFTSTSEIYAGSLFYNQLNIPTNEESMLAVSPLETPRTSYMLSKIYGEAMCHQSRLPITIIRPHNFYGPRMGMSHVIPEKLKEIHFAQENDSIDVFSPNHKRTFCYIEDAVNLMIKLSLSKQAEGQAFNIGNSSPEIKIIDLISVMTKVVNKKVSLIEGKTHPGSPSRRCPDISKSVNITNYSPLTSLKSGLKRTYEWYKNTIFDGKNISSV